MENKSNDQSQPMYPPQMENQHMKSESEFNLHNIPMRRIKGIMKSDHGVGMVSTEAQILVAKACGKFLADLTMRSWLHADENKRCTLQRSDIFAVVARTSIFEFLVDGLHKDESLTINPRFVAMPNPTAVAGERENENRENEGNGGETEV